MTHSRVHPIHCELDRGFAAKLRGLVERVTPAFERFNHAQVLQEAESFFWSHFTDTYLELVKLRARVNVKNPVEIEILRRSDRPMQTFPSEVKEQSPFKQDLRKCTEWVSWKRTKIESRAELAKKKWDESTQEHRDEYTIRRNDGWTAAEVQAP